MARKIGRFGILSGLAVMLALPQAVTATSAAPANDNWANRTPMAFFPFEDAFVDNTGASIEASEPQPGCAHVGKTVWYGIFPTSNYQVRLRATPLTNMDVAIAVYEGSEIYALSQLACADDAGAAGRETLTVGLRAHHGYYVQVGGYVGNHPGGTFTLRGKRLPAPPNDNFSSAATVPLGSVSAVSTIGATLEDGEPLCMDNVSRTVWYRFVPATTRTIVASTVGSDFDTVLTAFSGTDLSALSMIGCSDDAVQLQSKLKFKVYAGTTYYFQVGGYNGYAGSLTFQLRTP